jgi:hypothetical protein
MIVQATVDGKTVIRKAYGESMRGVQAKIVASPVRVRISRLRVPSG